MTAAAVVKWQLRRLIGKLYDGLPCHPQVGDIAMLGHVFY